MRSVEASKRRQNAGRVGREHATPSRHVPRARAQVKFLVRNGADTTTGKNGISPFHMACYRGHLDVVGGRVGALGPGHRRRRETPLVVGADAARRGKTRGRAAATPCRAQVTYLVVEVEVDARAVDGSGRTPLEVARRAGKEDATRRSGNLACLARLALFFKRTTLAV